MKYNEKTTLTALAEIKANQPPEFLMTEQQLKESVLANLPKSTICPKHNCQMEIFEGIGKTGNPYRAYRCGISGCKEILWTDREAETINAEVKDIESMLGIERPAATPAEGLEKKQKGIEKNINRREDSITEAAIRRDAVIFASTEAQGTYFPNPKEKAPEQHLKELHEKWLLYFETLYKK